MEGVSILKSKYDISRIRKDFHAFLVQHIMDLPDRLMEPKRTFHPMLPPKFDKVFENRVVVKGNNNIVI